MAMNRVPQHAVGSTPDANGFVVSRREQELSIRTVADTMDCPLMADELDWFPITVDVPDSHSPRDVGRGQRCAVRREREVRDRRRSMIERLAKLCRRNIPETHLPVVASGGDDAAIGAHCSSRIPRI